MPVTLAHLRRLAVAHSLFPPTTLPRAVQRLGFVQADPIRAPARAQDLTLRHRVKGYRAGDLDRAYARLDVEEDVFINYGYVSRAVYALMQPRGGTSVWSPTRRRRAAAILALVRERGAVHPRDVDERFAHGTVINAWGGTSNATTDLLEDMHYCGLLRVARREAGIRIYAPQELTPSSSNGQGRRERLDALVDIVVRKYAPLPAASLSHVVSRLRYAVPQSRRWLRDALQRAKQRLSHARVGGVDWYWPSDIGSPREASPDAVRLLSPFDPVVWDRRRFELFWGWPYRFEAYTPVAKRQRGYYALPLLWRDGVIGWANLSVERGELVANLGYVAGSRPRERAFGAALEEELDRMRMFLGLDATKESRAAGG